MIWRVANDRFALLRITAGADAVAWMAQAGWSLPNVSGDLPPPEISVSVKDDAKRSS
jgi:hypothetical protein